MRMQLLRGVVVACGLMISPRTVRAETEMPTPVAHWTFDEAGDEGRDACGTHHGTVSGATSHAGKVGRGLLFDRSRRDHVEVPHAADLELATFTVSAWVWLTKPPTYSGIVGTNGQGGDLEIERWYLVTFVIDAGHGECRLYLDGDRKKTIPFSGRPKLLEPGRVLRIGDTGAGEFMDGVIDDVRIYAAALTDAQVAALAGR